MLYMPSERTKAVLDDFASNIRLAQEFVGDFDLAAFRADVRTVYAVTRCLEIISEASRRLPEEVKQRNPHIPWPDIAAAGNIYRHQYEDVVDERIGWTVKKSLPPLLEVIVAELDAYDD